MISPTTIQNLVDIVKDCVDENMEPPEFFNLVRQAWRAALEDKMKRDDATFDRLMKAR